MRKLFSSFKIGSNEKQSLKLVSGFTLLELLIYITILSILVAVISNTFISLSKGQGQSQARSEVDSAIRFAAEIMKQDIKNATAVCVTNQLNLTPPYLPCNNSNPAGTPGSKLVLRRVIDSIDTEIVYEIANGNLTRNGINVANSNVLVDTIKNPTNLEAFTKIENINPAFNTKNVSIAVNIIFDYNNVSSDWTYKTALQTTISLYSTI